MAKKSKKKAIKTGCKNGNNRKCICSVHLGLPVTSETLPVTEDEGLTINRRRNKRYIAKSKSNPCSLQPEGKEYPIDLWYHVSRYIKPNQIKTFSLICQSSWNIINTSQFWLALYRKYVCNHHCLPLSLQPQNIDAKPGIKSRVIRALFHAYSPFKSKIVIEDYSPHIINKKCILFWWEKEFSTRRNNMMWIYNFKFTTCSNNVNNLRKGSEDANLLCSNKEGNNCVLKIKCPNYIYLSSVNGLILTSFNVNMSSDMRYQQLKMVFHSEKRVAKYNRNEGFLLNINPVIDFDVVHWWHPFYPCN